MLNKKHRAIDRAIDRGTYGIEPLETRQLLASMLVFTAEPTTTNAGSIINAPTGVQVTVETSAGVPITTNTDSITIAIGTNPGGATLGGTLTTTAVKGVATFSNLTVASPINGYTFTAKDNTTTSINSATSSAFNIDAIPTVTQLASIPAGSIGAVPESSLVMDASGNLFGTTYSGGTAGDGTVFELSGTNNSVYTTLVSFTGDVGAAPGANPEAPVVLDSNGNLYGTTYAGGAKGVGTVFELSGPSHSTFTSLVSFTGDSGNAIGASPTGGLTIDSAGNIVGTTSTGGANYGTVFTLTGPAHTNFTSLLSFTDLSGSFPGDEPDSTLAKDSAGNLYGVTKQGGSAGTGTIFELSGSNHATFSSIMSFPSSTTSGAEYGPDSDLYIDGSGNIFGTTDLGTGYGAVFELSGATHSTFTTVVAFTGSTGSALGNHPLGNFVADSAGNLYGVTEYGGTYGASSLSSGGTVFELSGAGHSTFTSLVSFNSSNGQNSPLGGLAIDPAGNLYGTNNSTVFLIPASNRSNLTTVYTFPTAYAADYTLINQAPAFVEQSALVIDSAGDLFGCDAFGGVNSDGTIYELSGPNHTVYSTLATFTGNVGNTPGQYPCGICLDGSGNLVGVTYQGGVNGDGTAFELSGSGFQTFTSLFAFTGTSGSYPGSFTGSGLTYESSTGNIYGVTGTGGASNDGTVFQLSGTNHSVFTSLLSFTGNSGAAPGIYPQASPTIDPSTGNLLGTVGSGSDSTSSGGLGAIYRLSGTNHSNFTLLYSFSGSYTTLGLEYPRPSLLIDGSGNLYGVALNGSQEEYPAVYELAAPGYTTMTVLAKFDAEGGYGLLTANIIFGSDGNIYGSSPWYSSIVYPASPGELFELSGPTFTTFTTLYAFSPTAGLPIGDLPYTALSVDSSGDIFGTTGAGGPDNDGTVFELVRNPSTSLTVTSGVVTIPPHFESDGLTGEYFSNLSVTSGATIVVTPTVSSPTVVIAKNLTFAGTTGAWTGTLDLTDNDLVLEFSNATLATVNSLVAEGYNGGKWNGQGITSSTAANDQTHLTALAVVSDYQPPGIALFSVTNPLDGMPIQERNDILVKYTYYGDANLDGRVDGSDYTLIDNGFNNHLTGWYNGDFNYDGKVDGSDYTLIDNAFNKQTVSLAVEVAATVARDNTAIAIAVSDPAWKRDHKASAEPAAASAASAVVTAASSRAARAGSAGGDSH